MVQSQQFLADMLNSAKAQEIPVFWKNGRWIYSNTKKPPALQTIKNHIRTTFCPYWTKPLWAFSVSTLWIGSQGYSNAIWRKLQYRGERHKEVNFRSLYIKNTNLPPWESCDNYLKNISSLETQQYMMYHVWYFSQRNRNSIFVLFLENYKTSVHTAKILPCSLPLTIHIGQFRSSQK